ncbi:MAG: hypothetical protein Q4D56_03140 [Bacteroides sp.]|nr:hypothetical protein [Bacteroides sp.]
MRRSISALRKCAFLVSLLCHVLSVYAQQRTIYGEVRSESSGEKIEGATVLLKSGLSSTADLLAYSITTADGTFSLKPKKALLDSAYIEVRCIGFKAHRQYISSGVNAYKVQLKEEVFTLKEVAVKAPKIRQSGDTISYNIASFATAQDRSIGDVLANMPGVSVSDNGQVSYNGSRISHLYIEGNDLFNEKYSIATQNLSYKNIARAEIIENHQSIKALASTNDDSKREVALNLTLKDGAKSKWGGYVQAAGGIRPYTWEGELFVANFSERFQSASTCKSNNSGKLIAKEHEALTLSDILNMQNYKDSQLSDFIQVSPTRQTDLNEDRIKTGTTHIVNSSNLWKWGKHTVMQSQIAYSDDHTNYRSDSRTSYFLTDSTLVMDATDQYWGISRNLQGEWSIKSNQDRYYLNNLLRASATWGDATSSVLNNNWGINQEAGNKPFTLSNKLEWIRKFGKHIVQVNSYSSYTNSSENLTVEEDSRSTQIVRRKHLFADAQASHSFDWKRWNFTTKANLQFVFHWLESEFQGLSVDTVFLNHHRVWHWQLKLMPQIAYKSRLFSFSLQVPLSYYQYRKTATSHESHWFYMPEVFCKWKVHPFFTLFASGAAGTLSSGYDYAYLQPIMSNYKTFSSGFFSFPGKKRARGTFRLSYANPIEMLFAHVSVSGSTDTSDNQVEKTVTNTHVFYNYRPGHSHSRMLMTDFSIQKGLDGINGKVNLHTMYQRSKSEITQNAVEESFRTTSFRTDLTVQSTIASWMDLKYTALFSSNRMKSSLYETYNWRTMQQLSVVCMPTKQWQLRLSGEHYYNHYASHAKQQIVLLDAHVSYLHKDNEWFCSIRNAFDERKYTYTAYSELSSQTVSYDIRPRTILIGFRRMF